jgi:hypothetical protein
MYQWREVKNANTGRGVSGYTVAVYNWSSGSSGYSGAAVYTMTDNGDGVYYFNCTLTFKGTIVVTSPGSTVVTVPTYLIGVLLHGDNVGELPPPVSS